MSRLFRFAACRSPLRRLSAALAAGLLLFPSLSAAHLSASQSQVAAGQTLSINLHTASPRSDSGFFALAFGGGVYFFNEQGGLVPYQAGTPTPRRLAPGVSGQQNLLSLTMPAGIVGNLAFYTVFGASGGDILANPAVLDLGTLESVAVTVSAGSAPVPTPTPTPVATGKSLYQQHCAACHDSNPLNNVDNILRGRDAEVTKRAIERDKGGMGYLSGLSDAEHLAIAQWLSNPQ